MKRTLCMVLALLLLAAMIGGCTTTPTPTPTANPLPAQTPLGSSPALTDDMGGNGTGGNTSVPGGPGLTIQDFAEGTEVAESDVPDIKSALQEKYEGASISRITHGLQGTQQVYVVEYTDQDGKVQTAYIAPDGTFITNDETNGTGNTGGAGGTNGNNGTNGTSDVGGTGGTAGTNGGTGTTP